MEPNSFIDFIQQNGVAGIGVVLLALIVGMLLKYTPRLIDSHLRNIDALTISSERTSQNVQSLTDTTKALAKLTEGQQPTIESINDRSLKLHHVVSTSITTLKVLAEAHLIEPHKSKVLGDLDYIRRHLDKS